MKNNKRKLNIKKIVFVVALAIILLLLILSITNKNDIQKIANYENALEIGGQTIDISKIANNAQANTPTVGAGMIPIKWNGSYWVITTADDADWYDYNSGKFANVMLSDGKYTSELTRGKELAVKDTQVQPEDLGTIFTWIPRFAYYEEQVLFLKGTNIIEYMYTTPGCFNLIGYGANSIDLGFAGIWVGQNEFSSETELTSKNTEMLQEENVQGLIANELVSALTTEEIEAVQKLTHKYSNTNETMIQNTDAMQYRQVIKILNTNNRLPIMGRYNVADGAIRVQDKYSAYGISFVTDKDGNILSNNSTKIDENETIYTFYIVDKVGNIRKYVVTYGLPDPDLRSFNINTTFYVTYDENGNEISNVPIGEKPPDNWYNYDNQQWANIVVRSDDLAAYYVWIPRYVYKLNTDGSQTVDAKIVDLENVYTDANGNRKDMSKTDYILPEAFTWEDPEDPTKVVQLRGFWTGKYKIKNDTSKPLEVSGGIEKIDVNNVLTTLGEEYTYEMYLIKDGKRIVKNGSEYIEGTEPIELTGNYTFTDLLPGEYCVNIIVKDADGVYVKAVATPVSIYARTQPSAPDLSEFNKNLTFYVTYDALGNEQDSGKPIGEDAPKDWYNYDSQQWANVVVRENGAESYFVWIPRYEYKLDEDNEKTIIQFIPIEQIEPDDGYTIPEAFTWEDPTDSTKVVQLSGYWIGKYKLRDDTSIRLDATVAASGNKIKVSNIVAANTDIVTFTAYLIKDGQIKQTATMTAESDHTFTVSEYGTYSVAITQHSTTDGIVAGFAKEFELNKIDGPDVTGLRVDMTYVVAYDDEGNEKRTVLQNVLSLDAVINDDNTLKSGHVEESKISGVWYDYAEQKWANIVVSDPETGNENYYVWIPRYQYILDSVTQKVKAILIPVTQTEPDQGYTIPEAFTWEDPEDSTKVVQLSGYWIGKYKLRAGN